MTMWVQLKDGVAFACVHSDNFVGNSIPVEEEIKWEDITAKKYEDENWVEAPLIYFVEELFGNKVLRVNSTVFSSDVTGPVCTSNVKPFWTMNEDGTFNPPATIGEATIYDESLFDTPETEQWIHQ